MIVRIERLRTEKATTCYVAFLVSMAVAIDASANQATKNVPRPTTKSLVPFAARAAVVKRDLHTISSDHGDSAVLTVEAAGDLLYKEGLAALRRPGVCSILKLSEDIQGKIFKAFEKTRIWISRHTGFLAFGDRTGQMPTQLTLQLAIECEYLAALDLAACESVCRCLNSQTETSEHRSGKGMKAVVLRAAKSTDYEAAIHSRLYRRALLTVLALAPQRDEGLNVDAFWAKNLWGECSTLQGKGFFFEAVSKDVLFSIHRKPLAFDKTPEWRHLPQRVQAQLLLLYLAVHEERKLLTNSVVADEIGLTLRHRRSIEPFSQNGTAFWIKSVFQSEYGEENTRMLNAFARQAGIEVNPTGSLAEARSAIGRYISLSQNDFGSVWRNLRDQNLSMVSW